VQNAARVREVNREANAAEHGQELVPRELRARLRVARAKPVEQCLQSLSAHALHREERSAVRVASEIVDRDDGGVLELPLHARLAEEAAAKIVAFGARGADDFHRHLAPDAPIGAQVHFTHAAFAELRERLVARRERLVGVELTSDVDGRFRRFDRRPRERRARLGERGLILVVSPFGIVGHAFVVA
jgi:hypothetical protein